MARDRAFIRRLEDVQSGAPGLDVTDALALRLHLSGPGGHYIEVCWNRSDDGLEIRTHDGCVIVRPRVSNVVEITMQKRS